MTQQHFTLRPAMTAIAAVLALSSTVSFAQSTETPAPIVETSPAPVPATPDPLAPDATTSTPDPVASETTAAPAVSARPAARASRPATRTTTTRTTSVARTRAAAPVAVDAAPPIAPPPVDPLVISPEMAAPVPVAAPIIEPVPAAVDQVRIEEALPYAGAAGLGLLALAGAGFAMRRGRRRREDAIEDAKWQHIIAAPDSTFEPAPAPVPAAVIAPAPTFNRMPKADAAPVAAAATGASNLPEGFDVSRFGPNVQAAYAGPSTDNPSASLKRRLTVGHFLDQKAAAAAEAAPAPSAGNVTAKPAWAARGDSEFMFRRDDKRPSLKPAYHK